MLKISSGCSGVDRISFSDSTYVATAIREPSGWISCELRQCVAQADMSDYMRSFFFLVGLSLFKVFVLIPFIEGHPWAWFLYLITAAVYFSLMVWAIVQVRKRGPELRKNHGAEHQVAAAYEKLKRVPTIEEVKRFSRINRKCGIAYYSGIISGQLIGFCLYQFANLQISEFVLVVIPFMYSTYFPFCLIGEIGQFWTTEVPDDANIELAISALNALDNRHLFFMSSFKSSFDEFFRRF